MSTVGAALAEAAARLHAAGCESPRLDAEVLLAEAIGVDRAWLHMHPEREVIDADAFAVLLARRETCEPVAYILGRKGFRHIELAVDPRVLVPRPETEALVEIAVGSVPEGGRVVDVGTGSGAVALAVKSERPDLDVVATDVSPEALEVARANARSLGLDVTFVETDLLAGVRGPFHLVLSNPPYVARRGGAPARCRRARAVARAARRAGRARRDPAARPAGGGGGSGDCARDRPAAVRAGGGAVASSGLRELQPSAGDRSRRRRAGRAMIGPQDIATFERCMRVGGVAVFPADTVYGLACEPDDREAHFRLYELKGRRQDKPAAVMFFDVELAQAALPELGGATAAALTALLPGAVTLLLPNPLHRFPLAGGPDPDTLGLRVPRLEGALAPLRALRWPVLQTSANHAGGPDARRLADVPQDIRAEADLVLDGGELPGTPSTVVDLRGFADDRSWTVIREGAVPASAIAAALSAL